MIPDRTLERAVSCRSWRAALFLFLVVSYALPASPVEGGVETRENALPDALAELYQAVEESPKNGEVWVRLGHTLLDTGDLKKAEKAFRKAIRYAKSAEAHNGLGLVYMADPLKRRLAVGCFKRALRADPSFIESQMNIARCHIEGGYSDAEKALKRAIEMDSTYAPAYLKLAEYYQDNEFEDRVTEAFRKYLSVRPDDVDGHYGLALVYTEQHRYGLVLEVAEGMRRAHPDDARFLALLGQACAARGDPDRALGLFEEYLRLIPEEESALYLDLSLVALPAELKAYQEISSGEQETFLQKFWRDHDPTIASGGVARRVEHYRRVWHAHAYFAEKAQPWDRRGEVYIRYGEPDYRSRSGHTNPLPSAAVEAIKERNHLQIHGEVLDSPSTDDNLSRRSPAEPTFPIDRDPAGITTIPWESWVYTGVGEGIELTFVDLLEDGRWGFPPVPEWGHDVPVWKFAQTMYLHPGPMLQRLASDVPERYRVPPGVEPLDFHYDFAAFRGTAGRTRLEVYFGIPLDQVGLVDREGRKLLRADKAVALRQRDGDDYRTQETLTVAVQEPGAPGGFIPDVASLLVPAGKYQLAVRLTDQVSGKWNIYLQDVEVPAFGDSLVMSDLEMAWTVSKEPREPKYRKGDVWVVPMPTRTYQPDQPVFVYYEVYNLTRDAFGRTRYRVEYAIREHSGPGIGVFGALRAGLKKLLPQRKAEVVVGYERDGTAAWEPIYLELKTDELKPGWSEVEVSVTDLNSGQTASNTALFKMDDE